MTRDEFRNSIGILITDSTDLPMQVVVEELDRACARAKDLSQFETDHMPSRRMKRKDFKVGDKVEHMNKSVGEVTKITDAVHVAFDGYHGEYDDLWFRTYPEGLKLVQQTPGA